MNYVGRYKIVRKIDEGGMASIFLAEYKGNSYALKILKKEHINDNVRRIRFKNESLAVKNFNHPNIIKIYEPAKRMKFSHNGKTGYTYAYSMEYIREKTFKNLLDNSVELTVEQINKFFSQVLDALQYCHEKKVYHRDLKPANILVYNHNNKLVPVLLDFGIAKMKNSEFDKNQNLTQEVSLLGAPSYMSPEQIFSPSEVDERSDLYSLGIILYETMTGTRPFQGSRNDLIQQHLNAIPTQPTKLNKQIPKEMEELILQLIEKKPENRPNTASEVKQLLEHSTTITIDPPKPRDNFFKEIIPISYFTLFKANKKINTKIFDKYPIIVGTKQRQVNYENILQVNGRPARINDQHFEIFKIPSNDLVLKDISNIGTVVNNTKIKNDIVTLKKGNNQIILPDKIKIEIVTNYIDRITTEAKILFSVISMVLILIIIILVISQ